VFREQARLGPSGGDPPDVAALQAAAQRSSGWVAPLRAEIARVIVGQHALVDRLMVALLTGGHVLLEGVPGLAKTLALKTLAQGGVRPRPGAADPLRGIAPGHHRAHPVREGVASTA